MISDITERRHLADLPAPADSAKQDGKGDLLVISDGSDHEHTPDAIAEQLTGWSRPEQRLRQALKHNEFQIYFQPVIPLVLSMPSQSCFKILLRLQEEEENHMPPGTFIPVAEQFNLTGQIDRWMIRRVAAQLKAHGMPAGTLCFELMAEEIAGRMPEAAAFADAMRRIGCSLMLNCFAGDGTMLELLKTLPVQYLRIDGDMAREVARDPALAWLKGLCRVSRTIGVRVITGQVESSSLRATLREAGVDYVQGYGIMRALPHDAPVHH